MRIEFTLFGRSGSRRDLVLEGLTPAGEALYRVGRPVDLDLPLSSGAIRNGDQVSVGTPLLEPGWPLEAPCLGVVGGSDAGRLVALDRRELLVGRGGSADVVIDDRTISQAHARLLVESPDRLQVTDLGSSNGTTVGTSALQRGETATVLPGERFTVGSTTLEFFAARPPDGSTSPGEEADIAVNRMLRYPVAVDEQHIRVPPLPPDPEPMSSMPQYVSAGTMAVVGVVSAVAFGNMLFAVLGVVAPAVLIVTTMLVNRASGRSARARAKAQVEERQQALRQIDTLVDVELRARWAQTLDPARAALSPQGPTGDLWSIDPSDEHAFRARVGTAALRASVRIDGLASDGPTTPTLPSVPVTVDFRATRVVGLHGGDAEVTAAARAIVLQLAAGRSPDDLSIVLLAEPDSSAAWEWLRWLPHTRPTDTVHQVSPSGAALKARLDDLTRLIASRVDDGLDPRDVVMPEVLVILDGAGTLRGRAGVVKILGAGPSVGISVLALDRQASRLPVEATARLRVGPVDGELEVRGSASIADIVVDRVSVALCDRAARAMAPQRPLGAAGEARLPRHVRFADLAGLGLDGAADVRHHWASAAEGEALLGVDEHGNPFVINLVTDGPHALVAGATGSGKSELLRSLIAGLALSATPEDLSFLLIDFKGGGAFGKLQDLPHVAGYADDLSIAGVLAGRLLESLRAELDHRKGLFKSAGNVEGLPEYRRAIARGSTDLPRVPRLVIVVDEFAELKEAQPDFVDGLVNVARVGRSLGVHLVLATQQPAGVVTPQIRDNANLRICLRVLDTSTSLDLVHTPAAGTFPNRQKGRAVVLSGDAPPVVIQSAHLSAPVAMAADATPAPTVRALPWGECGLDTVVPERVEEHQGETDLDRLVAAVTAASTELGLARPRRPWQPPMQDLITVTDFGAQPGAGPVLYGMEDRPREQRVVGLTFPLGGGNVGIAGGRASGRSSALRTLGAALAQRHTADVVHLHVIDHSSAPTLRALATLPHCGVVATRAEPFVTERLVIRLREEVTARAALLSRRGHATLRELREADPAAPPWIVVLVDGWDAIATAADESVRDGLVRLADEGPPLGIQLVVAGGKSLATSRLLTSFADLLVLPFEQRDDMSTFGIPVNAIAAHVPPGRAYRPGSADVVQLALLLADASPDAQNAAVRDLAATLATARTHPPLRIVELPSALHLRDCPSIDQPRDGRVVVAVGGDDASPRVVDLFDLRPPLLIGGSSRSGRTEALAMIAHQLSRQGVAVVVRSGVATDRERFPAPVTWCAEVPDEVEPGTALLVDDAHHLNDDDPGLLAHWNDPKVALVLALDPEGLAGWSGWPARLKSGTTGLLLSPQYGWGELIGARFTHADLFTAGPGRAYFGRGGRFELVQLPLAG